MSVRPRYRLRVEKLRFRSWRWIVTDAEDRMMDGREHYVSVGRTPHHWSAIAIGRAVCSALNEMQTRFDRKDCL